MLTAIAILAGILGLTYVARRVRSSRGPGIGAFKQPPNSAPNMLYYAASDSPNDDRPEPGDDFGGDSGAADSSDAGGGADGGGGDGGGGGGE